MADSNLLKVMYIFEAGARLKCNNEIISLAAHLYHRFFRLKHDMESYELLTFGSACIKLAYSFYEKAISNSDLVLIMASVAHGTCQTFDSQSKTKIEDSIDLAAHIIAINLNHEINYKDTRMMTPGELLRSRARPMEKDDIITIDRESSDEEESEDEDETERLLIKNSKHLISPHRYLVHYLKSVRLLVEPANLNDFKKISNIAWTFLNDLYWSFAVTQHLANHLACACFMMAIEVYRKELENKSTTKAKLWDLLNKKWNLIFCDDLDKIKLDHIVGVVIQQYKEYERMLQHELSTYVIDPTRVGHSLLGKK